MAFSNERNEQGKIIEDLFSNYARGKGCHVYSTQQLGTHRPALVQRPTNNVPSSIPFDASNGPDARAPDFLIDHNGKSYWVEVKAKRPFSGGFTMSTTQFHHLVERDVSGGLKVLYVIYCTDKASISEQDPSVFVMADVSKLRLSLNTAIDKSGTNDQFYSWPINKFIPLSDFLDGRVAERTILFRANDHINPYGDKGLLA